MEIILCIFFLVIALSELLAVFFTPAESQIDPEFQPRISILIVVRDEELSMDACLQSLLKQNYPFFEILIKDDDSIDMTSQIIDKRKKDNRIKVPSIIRKPVSGENPKAFYLHELSEYATGEFQAIADGDCIYPETWLSGLVSQIGDAAVISGVTGVHGASMEDMDWKLNIGRMNILSRMGFNTSAIGNNMLIRVSSLNKVGGWKSVVSFITEDFAIYQKLIREGFKGKSIFKSTILAYSESTPILARFNQRKRWMQGIQNAHILILLVIYLHALLLPAVMFSALAGFQWALLIFGIYMLLRFINDVKLLALLKQKSGLNILSYHLYSLIWSFAFLLYHLLISNFQWKKRRYS